MESDTAKSKGYGLQAQQTAEFLYAHAGVVASEDDIPRIATVIQGAIDAEVGKRTAEPEDFERRVAEIETRAEHPYFRSTRPDERWLLDQVKRLRADRDYWKEQAAREKRGASYMEHLLPREVRLVMGIEHPDDD